MGVVLLAALMGGGAARAADTADTASDTASDTAPYTDTAAASEEVFVQDVGCGSKALILLPFLLGMPLVGRRR